MPVRLAVFLIALAFVPGCTCASDSVNRGDLNLVSLDDEWALGNELAAEVDAQIAAVPDKEVQLYVAALGAALAAETELADRPWTFTAVADPAVNAFALPGGHVYVHAGLIAAAETEAELASVVGHEVAHVAARHSTERMVKAQGLAVVAGLVLGNDPGLVRQLVAGIIGQGALARFSRSDEREADELGLAYMANAGFDPDGQAAMFETLVALREREPGRFEQWFGTHPLGEERVERAVEAAAAMPEGGTQDSDRFRDVRARVLAAQGWAAR
ncbi:M48 family metalloprotease [Rubrivirga sp. IMCC45206]|uniref:M48 family metalloprotease n=1 Tax=Rubrivirga sp. IMCC45206 TaxID=3391614 RepID=UPI00398F95EF